MTALPQKSQYENLSAKGAEYVSQGQALSGAKRVAPGFPGLLKKALKVRNSFRFIPLFQSFTYILILPGATRFAPLSASTPARLPRWGPGLPLADIFRAFGAAPIKF